MLASLNHPNIGSIYGLEEAEPSTGSGQEGGKFRALVLELVEGPTLADRIKQGPIPVDEALPIAKQIAEALERHTKPGSSTGISSPRTSRCARTGPSRSWTSG